MLTIKCPHCAAAMRLKQAPASGKVQCPKCNQVVKVGQQRAKAAVSGGDDPDDGFDFASLNVPGTAAAPLNRSFPVSGGLEVYDGPIPGDPLEQLEQEQEESSDSAEGEGGSSKKKSKKLSTPALIGIAAGVLVVLGGAVVGGAMLTGPPETQAAPTVRESAPEGYQLASHLGAYTFMPKGIPAADGLNTVMEFTAVESEKSGAFFFFGVMDAGTQEITLEQLKKKVSRQFKSGIVGGAPRKRNGYEGYYANIDGSLFVPDMTIEMYIVKERLCVLGLSSASEGGLPEPGMSGAAEAEETKYFYDKFKVGPKPKGWFF
ncbi:MAG: MJ0042-type zinc finger domain-containing protein [Planctomycetota bacterium]